MMTIRHACLPTILVSTLMTIACSGAHKPGYTADVRPILDKHCAECHMPDMEGAQKSGFQIDSYASIMKGTKFGPVIVPGSADSSTLYILVAGKANPKINMPHGKQPLSPSEIETLRLWIDQGAMDN
jgi:mono/diheme cytochrome c family protein